MRFLCRSLHCLALAALGLVLAQPAAHAILIIGAEQYNPGIGPSGPPTPINCVSNDLLQTSLSGATGERTAEWRSGLYADAVTYSDSPFVTTYALDVANNPSGYDLKEIRVFSGWHGYRSAQAYDLLYSFVWAPDTFLTLGTVLTPSDHNGAVMTRSYDSSASASPDAGTPILLLSGVARIRFNIRPNGLGAVYRKFDVTGSPTPPGASKNITSFTFPTSGEASIIGSNINVGGTCTIVPALKPGTHNNLVAVYSGDMNFASSTSGTLGAQTVSTKALTVTGTAVTPKTYDGTSAGNYTLSGATGAVTVTPKSLTVTGLTAGGKTYDGPTTVVLTCMAALTAAVAVGTGTTADGKPYSGDALTLGGTDTGTFVDPNSGTAKPVIVTGKTLTGAQAGNDSLTQPSGLTATITPAALTVTADNQSKTYGQTVTVHVTTAPVNGK